MASCLIYVLPLSNDEALHWWLVADGVIASQGYDANPYAAAGFNEQSDLTVGEFSSAASQIALLPTSACVVRSHNLDEGLTTRQRLSASIAEARAASLDGDQTHIAALQSSSDQTVTAAASNDIMEHGLARLNALGLDPDYIVPAGSLIPAKQNSWLEADLGFERILRSGNAILPNEIFVRDHVIGDQLVNQVPKAEVDDALANALDQDLLNLRSGIFAKKTKNQISPGQKKKLGWLVAALFLVSIAIPAVGLLQNNIGASRADQAALEAARSVVGPVDSIEAAENAVDEKLVGESRGNMAFSGPASALFAKVQQSPGVVIDTLSYNGDGTVLAGLSAIRNEDINPVLIALQNDGFKITATPRTDATGAAKANISLRAP